MPNVQRKVFGVSIGDDRTDVSSITTSRTITVYHGRLSLKRHFAYSTLHGVFPLQSRIPESWQLFLPSKEIIFDVEEKEGFLVRLTIHVASRKELPVLQLWVSDPQATQYQDSLVTRVFGGLWVLRTISMCYTPCPGRFKNKIVCKRCCLH